MQNSRIHIIVLLCLAALLSGCGQSVWKSVSAGTGPLKDDREKLSYALGMTVGSEWKKTNNNFDSHSAALGMNDALNGNLSKSALSATQALLASSAAQMQTQAASDKPAANDQLRNRVSYAMGVNLGEAWKMMRMDVDPGCIARGINNFLQGNEQVMTLDEARAVVTQFGEQLAARQEAERKALGDKNRTEGAAFLERNKTRAGVITTASGLQYKVLAEGTGDFAQPDSWVAVKYQGTLLDGTEIDNSQRYSQPCVFSVRSVLPGWSEALQMMKPGAKWQLVLPPDLAYGSQGGLGVGPDATLIYTFELVSILPGRPEPNAEQITQMNKD